jgi:hypothetical protein
MKHIRQHFTLKEGCIDKPDLYIDRKFCGKMNVNETVEIPVIPRNKNNLFHIELAARYKHHMLVKMECELNLSIYEKDALNTLSRITCNYYNIRHIRPLGIPF